MTTSLSWDDAALRTWQRGALLAGLAASLICIVWGFFNPDTFFRAYLTPSLYLLGLALGSLALVMIHHLTGGAWGVPLRSPLEAMMQTLPWIGVLFLPVIIGAPRIFAWADPATRSEALHGWLQPWWLEIGFFRCRAVAYFVLWSVLAGLLARWSGRNEESGDVAPAARCASFSGPGLVLYGLSLHFAGIDWLMSLETETISTMLAPKIFASQILSAFAFSIVFLCHVVVPRDGERLLSKSVFSDIGGLLFTFLIVWAYMVWFEFMLMWIADLPGATAWLLSRERGLWGWLALALVVFNFFIPFFLLLFRTVKRSPPRLARVAVLILGMQYLFIYSVVVPAFANHRYSDCVMDLLAPIGLGGLWLARFLAVLRTRLPLPRHDIYFAHLLHLREVDRELAKREEIADHG